MKIQALPTTYDGVTFRSRTEARWAMAMTLCGEQWEYEPEGFALPSGPYLPDFWLPKRKCYAEVKGKPFTEDEREKCVELAQATQCKVLMLDGPPMLRCYWLVDPDPRYDPIDVMPWPFKDRGFGGCAFWVASCGCPLWPSDLSRFDVLSEETWMQECVDVASIRAVRAKRWA